MPSPVIKQELQAKIERTEAEQHRKLKKTEKDALKDEVLHSLLPRAFSRFNQTFMWIDTVNDLIMVDAASAKRAEDTLALLRKPRLAAGGAADHGKPDRTDADRMGAFRRDAGRLRHSG